MGENWVKTDGNGGKTRVERWIENTVGNFSEKGQERVCVREHERPRACARAWRSSISVRI